MASTAEIPSKILLVGPTRTASSLSRRRSREGRLPEIEEILVGTSVDEREAASAITCEEKSFRDAAPETRVVYSAVKQEKEKSKKSQPRRSVWRIGRKLNQKQMGKSIVTPRSRSLSRAWQANRRNKKVPRSCKRSKSRGRTARSRTLSPPCRIEMANRKGMSDNRGRISRPKRQKRLSTSLSRGRSITRQRDRSRTRQRTTTPKRRRSLKSRQVGGKKVLPRSNSTVASSTKVPCNSIMEKPPDHTQSLQKVLLNQNQTLTYLLSIEPETTKVVPTVTKPFEEPHAGANDSVPVFPQKVLLKRSGTGVTYVPYRVAPPTMLDSIDRLQSMVIQRSRAKLPTLADDSIEGGFEAIAVRALDGSLTAGILASKKGDPTSADSSTRRSSRKKMDGSERRSKDPWEHAIADLVLW